MRSFLVSALGAIAMAGDADYTLNGADWPGLCQTGKEQSPIDFGMVTLNDKLALNLDGYMNFPEGKMDKLSNTLQFNTLGENTDAVLTLTRADGSESKWKPAQFHFHAPSEHTVGGKLMDLEIHFVHLADASAGNDGFAAVLGVFFDREAGGNEPNPFIESLKFDETTDQWDVSDVNVKDFLEGIDKSSFMSYDGSLTTPPCTEGVKWTVFLQAQPISDAQLKAFTDRYAGNPAFYGDKGSNRVTLPLNGRTVSYTGFTGSGAASLGAAALAIAAVLSF